VLALTQFRWGILKIQWSWFDMILSLNFKFNFGRSSEGINWNFERFLRSSGLKICIRWYFKKQSKF
jgi:hypothetical protein